MHTTKILLLCSLLISASAQAGTYEWTSGWGMGVSEHQVDDGNGNDLNISCPDYEEVVITNDSGAKVPVLSHPLGEMFFSTFTFDIVKLRESAKTSILQKIVELCLHN
ncbi:hypothetical protein [Pseudomonas fluvialis]|uniref:hypothetical protein n=1 Tax=Pseudomonas fluvialis TaxID=1793966 RepID=UPI0035B0C3A8